MKGLHHHHRGMASQSHPKAPTRVDSKVQLTPAIKSNQDKRPNMQREQGSGIGDRGLGIPSKTKPDQQRHARLIMEMSSDVDSSPCEVSNRTAEMEKYIHLVRAICLQCLDTCDNFKQHLHGNLLNSCDSLLSYFC